MYICIWYLFVQNFPAEIGVPDRIMEHLICHLAPADGLEYVGISR